MIAVCPECRATTFEECRGDPGNCARKNSGKSEPIIAVESKLHYDIYDTLKEENLEFTPAFQVPDLDTVDAEPPAIEKLRAKAAKGEYTGGSTSYYKIRIDHPTSPDFVPYDAECNDIIEALEMSFAEGNAFKAIWRRAAARLGKTKKGYTDGLYDAEKVVFFGQRMVAVEKRKR